MAVFAGPRHVGLGDHPPHLDDKVVSDRFAGPPVWSSQDAPFVGTKVVLRGRDIERERDWRGG